MAWQATPLALSLIVAAAVLVLSVLGLWLRRPMPGHKAGALIALASAEWLLGYAFELGSTTLAAKDFWNKLQYVGIVCIAPLWLIFTLLYIGRKKWLTRANLILLGLEPAVVLLLVLTNESHGLIWVRGEMAMDSPFSRLVRPHSMAYWLHLTYSYTLLLLVILLQAWVLVHSRHLYRHQVSALLLSAVLPLVANLAMQLDLNPFPNLDLTPMAVTVSGLTIVWSLFRLRVWDTVPVARDAIVENLSDGVIVLDTKNRVVDLNLSAERIFDLVAAEAIGRPISKIWPGWEKLACTSCDAETCNEDIFLARDGVRRAYDARISPILDWRDQLASRVVVLRDITERKKAIEATQQWTARLEQVQEFSVELASQLDLDSLLDTITRRAIELLDGDAGGLALYRPERESLKNVTAVGEAALMAGNCIRPGEGLAGQVWQRGEAIVIDDYGRFEERVPDSRCSSPTAALGVPVCWGDNFLGVLSVIIEDGDKRDFSSTDIELLSLLAAQAAAAIRNARQYEEERTRAAQLTVVNQVARKVASILDIDQLLQEIVVAIQKGFSYCYVAILLLNEAGDELGHLTSADASGTLVNLNYRQQLGEGLIGCAAQTGQPVLVSDVSQDPRYIEGFGDGVRTQSELSIPIKLAERVIGVLDVQDTRLNAFDDMDLMAMQTLADQIAVAINNARSYEKAQRQANRLAIVNRFARAAGSTLHLNGLLRTVSREIGAILEADAFFIALHDEEDGELEFRLLIDNEVRKPLNRVPLGKGWTSFVVTEGRALLVRDYEQERDRLPEFEMWDWAEVPASWLGVPMQVGGRVVGVIGVQSSCPNAYGEEELSLLSTIADQMAVTVEKVKLFQAERMQRRQAELLAETIAFISSTLDVDRVLVNILRGMCGLLDVTAGSVWLADSETGELVCKQATGPQSDVVRGWRLQPGQGIAGWVAHYGRSLIVSDTQADERYFRGVDLETGVPLRSLLSTPIQLQDEVIGVLQVADTQTDRFSTSEQVLAESLASAAAVAIENARLYGQAQRDAVAKSALLREVNHRVKNNLSAIIGLLYAERRRAGNKDLDVYEAILQDLANRVQGLATVHSLLSASEWSDLSLSELTTRIIQAAMEMLPQGKRISVDVPSSSVRVTPDQAHNLALIINEMATNTIKHGFQDRDTVHISIRIEQQNGMVTFEFQDDGPGYPADVLESSRHSVGFDLIQNIVRENLRGELSISSHHGAVATIRFKASARDHRKPGGHDA